MHPAAYDYVARYATDDPIDLVEIGARNVNYTVRPLFPNARYHGIDAQPGECVDEVADGATWQPPEPVDLVICAEVFEHTPDWRAIVANVPAMLRPGGRAVFTMAGPGRPPHGVNIDDPLSPGHYANISVGELAEAMAVAGFAEVEVDQLVDDTRGTARTRPAAVLTTLLCATEDPQRGKRWPPVGTVLDQLLASLGGVPAVVLHDRELDPPPTLPAHLERVAPGGNPYHYRWSLYDEWLADAGPVGWVWCVDGTDVEMLHAPWSSMVPGVLYCGSEPITSVSAGWLADGHPSHGATREDRPLLNAGILGGDVVTVRAFVSTLVAELAACGDDLTDMAAFNRVAAGFEVVTGERVHTSFRGYEHDHPTAWWRHK